MSMYGWMDIDTALEIRSENKNSFVEGSKVKLMNLKTLIDKLKKLRKDIRESKDDFFVIMGFDYREFDGVQKVPASYLIGLDNGIFYFDRGNISELKVKESLQEQEDSLKSGQPGEE